MPYYAPPIASRRNKGPAVRKHQKRKRGSQGSESDDDSEKGSDAGSDEGSEEGAVGALEEAAGKGPTSSKAPASSSYTAWAALPVDIARAYKAAGQSPEEEPPPYPFPHASLQSNKYLQSIDMEKELSALNPPLRYTGSSEAEKLKQHHSNMLTTLMHRCLQEGDYIRAERAFGLILRTEVGGLKVDIRTHSLWSIGAEIKLRKEMQLEESQYITAKAFEAVKRYYDLLILEYPYRTGAQSDVSATLFYPALYKVWIAYAQDQKKASDEIATRCSSSSSSDDDEEEGRSRNAALAQIRASTLLKALDIATNMDETLQTFPFQTDPTLWELRGNLALWIADLSAVSTIGSPGKGSESPMSVDREESSTDGHDQDGGVEAKKEQDKKAAECFEMVKKLTLNA